MVVAPSINPARRTLNCFTPDLQILNNKVVVLNYFIIYNIYSEQSMALKEFRVLEILIM